MGRYRLGVVDVTLWSVGEPVERAKRAKQLGFEHIDVGTDVDPESLVLPVGCPTSFPKPQPGWCTTPAPRDEPGMWERTVRWFRRSPGALLEPWAGAVVNSRESAQAMMAEVPGLRLLVDTGHVSDWGEDALDLLEFADHVQLRQGKPGSTQVHIDDPSGVVDFAKVIARLDDLEYKGCLSVEYFDLPEHGWGLEHPIEWAVALKAHLEPLLA
jgi:D-psicose/D-tagatose/L-ribulose 3-epimerase